MKQVEMNDIETSIKKNGWFGGRQSILIPGGWQAYVPEVEFAKAEDRRVWMNALLDDYGGDPTRAKLRAEEILQQLVDRDYVSRLEKSIAYRARQYAQEHPELVREDETLGGFDPEEMQRYFLPMDNVGRAGKATAKEAMERMATQAKEESDE